MAIIGTTTAVRAQCREHAGISAALDFIARALDTRSAEHAEILALAEGGAGRVELGGGVTALTSHARGKTYERARWETHVKHIDVQAVVTGGEFMEFGDISEMIFKEDLTAEKDAVFYEPYEEGSRIRARPGMAVVFFPADAHRASIALDDELRPVRKIVVKVPV